MPDADDSGRERGVGFAATVSLLVAPSVGLFFALLFSRWPVGGTSYWLLAFFGVAICTAFYGIPAALLGALFAAVSRRSGFNPLLSLPVASLLGAVGAALPALVAYAIGNAAPPTDLIIPGLLAGLFTGAILELSWRSPKALTRRRVVVAALAVPIIIALILATTLGRAVTATFAI